MGNQKHVMPDTNDTFASRVKRFKRKKEKGLIYGPDNRLLKMFDMETGAELDPKVPKKNKKEETASLS